jgi:hypothetical protein
MSGRSNSTLSVRLDRPDLALHDIDGENPALAWLSGISRSEMPRNRLKLPNRQSTTKQDLQLSARHGTHLKPTD